MAFSFAHIINKFKTTSEAKPSLPEEGDLYTLLKRVRHIEIKSRTISNHVFSGAYHSAFKGRGMSFSEVREYQVGDDVRNIDWHVSARARTPYIKVFEEEREMTLMLLVDVSASTLFGTEKFSKRDVITDICAVLAFSAIQNHDKVGVLFFSDRIEKFIPPKKGKTHVLYLIRELLSIQPRVGSRTDINVALRFMQTVIKTRCISFVLSDFIANDYATALRMSAKRHELVGIQIYDKADQQLPEMGLLQVVDPETGMTGILDTSDKAGMHLRRQYFQQHLQFTQQNFRKAGADYMSLHTGEDAMQQLQGFFKARLKP